MARDPVVFEVQAFPQTMYPEADTLDEQWMAFFAQQETHLRFISMTRRFDLRGPQQQMQQLNAPLDTRQRLLAEFAPLAAAIETWTDTNQRHQCEAVVQRLSAKAQDLLIPRLQGRDLDDVHVWIAALDHIVNPMWLRRWRNAYWQMYEQLMTSHALRGLKHYVVAWPTDGVRADDIRHVLSRTFDTTVRAAELPSFINGEYQEAFDYMTPVDPDNPFVAFLTMYDLKGTWDVWTIHRLLDLDLDIALCIDIAPVSRTKAEMQADFAATATMNNLNSNGPRDATAERRLQAALSIQSELGNQSLHDMRMVIAVTGRDADELRKNIQTVKGAGGSLLKLKHPRGGQKPLHHFFDLTPTANIDSAATPRRVLSRGVACTVPFGLRRPDRTDGIWWVREGSTPIMFAPWADRRAAHMVILGKTGSGKTYAFNVWAMRMAALGHQIIMYEPQGHSKRLIAAAAPHGGRHQVLDLRQHVNILDVIATRDEHGRPPELGAQTTHVITQLAVLLGISEPTTEGKVITRPRTWTSFEYGLLDLALQAVYDGLDLEQLPTYRTPILADLCDALSGLQDEEAKRLAREIELRLVRGTAGSTFNAHTTVDWDFTRDITAFDFSAIPEGAARTFYYGQAFGALNRYVRSPLRRRDRMVIPGIDEFAYMAQVPALAQFAAMAVKTWRTFGAALVTMDQDAHTYLGTENGSPDASMLSIFLNTTIKVLFRQDGADAERLGRKIEGLQPEHVSRIKTQGRGDCVIVWEGDQDGSRHPEVYTGTVDSIDSEDLAFAGT